MRLLVIDPFNGAAGDMITGALLDCGADREQVQKAMRAVVGDPSINKVDRCGISATKVETRATATTRTLDQVMSILDIAAPEVPERALAMAKRAFLRLNAAEEKVHGSDKHMHFHAVGADDAIADVIGACTALYTLKVEKISVLPIALGSGTVISSHGKYPVPAPATLEILKGSGLEMRPRGEEGELCTPTGAALLAEFASVRYAELPCFTISSIGYGAGTRNSPEAPNVLRVMVAETSADGKISAGQDQIDVLETNVDDVSGEVIANALTRFMKDGARDASAIPIIMKKGRPGFLIRVITGCDDSAQMAKIMANDLGTLGIRCVPAVHRFVAARTVEEIDVEIAGQHKQMPVKCGWIDGMIYTMKAEFEPARGWADELGMPVRHVLHTIEEVGWKMMADPKIQSGGK